MRWLRLYSYLFFIGGGTILLDQITKIWIDNNMRLFETKPILSGFFDFYYIRNPGAAFGTFSNSFPEFRIPFFIGISIIAICIILFLYHKQEETEIIMPVALSLVLGGAVGNLIDRIRMGEVIDFLLLHYNKFRWPAFNVADIAISAGVFLLLLRMAFLEIKQSKGQKP